MNAAPRSFLGLSSAASVVTFALVGLLGSVTLTACDLDGTPIVDAEVFEEGVRKDSDDGAFRVVLTTDDASGLRVGDNTVHVRLGFHDPSDPLGAGRGIPSADVTVVAWMPYGDGSADPVRGVYVGDGEYALDLELPESGIWQLDFALAVGDGVDDSVSFAFVIGNSA